MKIEIIGTGKRMKARIIGIENLDETELDDLACALLKAVHGLCPDEQWDMWLFEMLHKSNIELSDPEAYY